MTLEQQLRESLSSAAELLVVPPPGLTPSVRRRPVWPMRLAVAGIGALAVVALIILPVILRSPGEPAELGTLAAPVPPSETSASVFSSSSTTPAPPTTTASVEGHDAVLGQATAEGYQVTLAADKTEEGDMPTASLSLLSTDAEGAQVSEAMLGEPAGFFWHSVTEDRGICMFTTLDADAGVIVAVQPLLSASLGCSDPFLFDMVDGRLSPREPAAQDVARLFVEAWADDASGAIALLGTAEAVEQVGELTPPVGFEFRACESAAGTVYCTWAGPDPGPGRTVVVAVTSQPEPRVSRVNFAAGD